VNRILYAVLTVALLGSSSALAQSDPQSPVHRERSDRELAVAGESHDLMAGRAERTSAKLRDDGAPRQSESAAEVRAGSRLSDPKSGCAAFAFGALPVDAVADDPLASVVLGTGKMLSDFRLLRKIKID